MRRQKASKEIHCPGCDRWMANRRTQRTRKIIQHHLWGGHQIDVVESHELARKIVARERLTEQDIALLKAKRV